MITICLLWPLGPRSDTNSIKFQPACFPTSPSHQGPLSLIKVNKLKFSPIRPCSTMRSPVARTVALPQHHTLFHSHTLVPRCSWPAKYCMLLKWSDLKYPLKIMSQLFSPPVSGKQSILQCYHTKPSERATIAEWKFI